MTRVTPIINLLLKCVEVKKRRRKKRENNANMLKCTMALVFFSCTFKSVQKFDSSLERPLSGEQVCWALCSSQAFPNNSSGSLSVLHLSCVFCHIYTEVVFRCLYTLFIVVPRWYKSIFSAITTIFLLPGLRWFGPDTITSLNIESIRYYREYRAADFRSWSSHRMSWWTELNKGDRLLNGLHEQVY